MIRKRKKKKLGTARMHACIRIQTPINECCSIGSSQSISSLFEIRDRCWRMKNEYLEHLHRAIPKAPPKAHWGVGQQISPHYHGTLHLSGTREAGPQLWRPSRGCWSGALTGGARVPVTRLDTCNMYRYTSIFG